MAYSRELYFGGEFEQSDNLSRLYGDISAVNSALREQEDATCEDIDDLLIEFNARWPYLNEDVVVLGTFFAPEIDGDDEASEESGLNVYLLKALEKGIVPGGLSAVSYGFSYMTNEDGVIQIGHHLQVTDFRIESSQFQEVNFKQFAFARIEEVEVIPLRRTNAQIEASARHYYPELMEKVDVAVFNQKDFEGAVKSLGQVRQVGIQGEDSEQELGYVVGYVNRILDFDTKLPYLVRVDSDRSGVPLLCHILGVALLEVSSGDSPSQYEFYLDAEVHLKGENKDSGKALIYTEDVLSIVAVRSLFGYLQ